MVTLQILVLSFQVRILVAQHPKTSAESGGLLLRTGIYAGVVGGGDVRSGCVVSPCKHVAAAVVRFRRAARRLPRLIPNISAAGVAALRHSAADVYAGGWGIAGFSAGRPSGEMVINLLSYIIEIQFVFKMSML